MSYIDEFLDINSGLPREAIRNLKLIKEIDEKSVNIQKNINENRKKMIYLIKSKIRNEKAEQEILQQIEKEHHLSLNLTEHKMELVNELSFIMDYHLKKLNEIIENFEKSIQSSPPINGIVPGNYAIDDKQADKATSVDDNMSIPSKRRLCESVVSSKGGAKEVQGKLLGKKKHRAGKGKKREDEIEEVQPPMIEQTIYEYTDKQLENEPTYCFCNTVSYGDMIKCDNDQCEKEWFHFPCVNLTIMPKGNWYCSEECKAKGGKKKKVKS